MGGVCALLEGIARKEQAVAGIQLEIFYFVVTKDNIQSLANIMALPRSFRPDRGIADFIFHKLVLAVVVVDQLNGTFRAWPDAGANGQDADIAQFRIQGFTPMNRSVLSCRPVCRKLRSTESSVSLSPLPKA